MERIRRAYSSIVSYLKSTKGVKLAVSLGVLGLLLVLLSDWDSSTTSNATTTTTNEYYSAEEYRTDLELRLTELIRQVQGAGSTQVMVTLNTSERNVYAQEVTRESKSDGTSEYESKYVTINTSDGKSALLDTVQPPEILGVVVLCNGGAKATVKEDIYSIVTALTGLKASSIFVGQLE